MLWLRVLNAGLFLLPMSLRVESLGRPAEKGFIVLLEKCDPLTAFLKFGVLLACASLANATTPSFISINTPTVVYQGPTNSWLAFQTAADGNVYYKWSTSTGWSGWYNLASPAGVRAVSPPTVINQYNDNTDWLVFITGADGNVYYQWSTPGSWSGWYAGLGSPGAQIVSQPSVGWQGSTLEVFATAADGNVYYKWGTSSSWSAWDGYIGNPGVQIVSQPGIGLENGSWLVFATGADGNIYYKWSTSANPTGWSGWDGAIGSPGVQITSMPAVGYQGGSWLVYATGADGNVYYKWSVPTSVSQTGWSGWDGAVGSPGVQIVSPPSVAYQSGTWMVFATGADGNVYYKWSVPTSVSQTGWSGWDGAVGRPGVQIVSAPTIEFQNGNSWMVFATGSDGNVYYNWSNSTGWSGWDNAVGSANAGGGVVPSTPVKEYIYFNGRIIAIENGGG